MDDFYMSWFEKDLRVQGLTEDSLNYYVGYIRSFIRTSAFTSVGDFDDLLKMKMAYYALFEGARTNNTIYKYYKVIKKYTTFLREQGLISNVHINGIKRVKTTKPLPKSLSEEQTDELINKLMQGNKHSSFLKNRNYIIVLTVLFTGLRRIEIASLKRDSVFPKHIIVQEGKGKKDRIIYIPREFSLQLHSWLDKHESEWVFCTKQETPLGREALTSIFKRIKHMVGFPLTAHLLRHTYASMCIKRGINLHTLQQQMGHSNISTTSIYLYLNSTENYNEMQKLRL